MGQKYGLEMCCLQEILKTKGQKCMRVGRGRCVCVFGSNRKQNKFGVAILKSQIKCRFKIL